MIGQNQNLRLIATRLESIIAKQEDIAKSLKSRTQDRFNLEFAQKIVKKKLESSDLNFQESTNSQFPFSIELKNEYEIAIGVVGTKLLEDERKSAVTMYCNSILAQYDKFRKHSGIIMCLPYMLNSKTLREELYKKLPVAFVNLGYDKNSLERRFRQYCE